VSALPTLALRATAGWEVRAVTLGDGSGRTLAIALEPPALPAERLPGAALQRIGDREVAISRDGDAVRLFTAGGDRGWLGVLDAAAGDETVAAAAALLAGARTEVIAPALNAAYSHAELTAAAELAGLSRFPGVDGAAPADERARVDARRALAARGTVVTGPDGGLAFAAHERPLLEVPLRPAAVLDAERRAAGAARHALVSWTPATSVAQSGLHPGVMQLTGFPSSLLPEWLAAFGAEAELILRVLQRAGRRLAGQELRWPAGPSAGELRERLADALDAPMPTG
jgi:hypothetical protein